ncbi:MAG: hypothetical protein ACK519_10695 [Sphingomonadaceae bacterium]|jgi:hypothetical protein
MSKSSHVYIRFVCFQLVEGQRQRLGLFQALDEARDCDFAPAWASRQIGESYDWFKENLTVPSRFEKTWGGQGRSGLSWFKPFAIEHIKQMHQLKLAVEECGLHVEILTTRDPGTMIWQDDYQLVADPGKRKF